MKICYMGHPAHEWSGSSRFFEDMLRNIGNVDIFRPTTVNVDEIIWTAFESDYDIYIFFQFDFLAYAFLAAGKTVVVVPMIDGSAGYGGRHWHLLRGATFVSFSQALHNFLLFRKEISFNIKYFPEPELQNQKYEDYVYGWIRTESDFWNATSFSQLLKNYSHLKIRLRSPSNHQMQLPARNVEYVDISSREDHLQMISNCSVYIGARTSEGIGFSFLEALARSKPVLAYDYPTMNEYIRHLDSGFLVNSHNKKELPTSDLRQMGKNAGNLVVQGRKVFQHQLIELMDFLKTTKNSSRANLQNANKILDLMDLSISIYRGNSTQERGVLSLKNYIRFSNFLG